MAAVLELLLRDEVAASAVVRWLKASQGSRGAEESEVHPKLALLNSLQKDFVPFLLNYLREQTSRILTNGPSTPAKTPNSKHLGSSASYRRQRTGSERRTQSTEGFSSSKGRLFYDATPTSLCTSNSSTSLSESHEFSVLNGSSITGSFSDSLRADPSTATSFTSSPSFTRHERRSTQKTSLGSFLVSAPMRRGRRKGNSSVNGSDRPVAQDLERRLNEEAKQDSSFQDSPRQRKQGELSPASSTSPSDQLNLNDLEEFPPMSATGVINKSKPSRRINPTPVSTDRTLSKPKMCFTSTPVGQSKALAVQSGISPEGFSAFQEVNLIPASGSLQEEREMLKKERSKLSHHTSSSAESSLDSGMSVKPSPGLNTNLLAENHLVTSADVTQVSCKKQIEQLAQMYSLCIAENLVPSIFLEFFFVLQLLTAKGTSSVEERESDLDFSGEYKDAVAKQHFCSIHNCVYFAVRVLDYQFEIVSHLEKGTLKLLAENDRIASFSPVLHERLMTAYENSTAKVSLLLPSCVQSVSFQPETDNRFNFSSDKAFHIFKKQRDIFYELLREWEDNSEKPGWDFEKRLGERIRVMMAHLSAASNYSHFARLFLKQLLQMCKGPVGGGTSWGDTPDQDVLNMLGPDNLSRLKRLQERFLVPQNISGPCPPPSFPGCQQFFRDFILSAGSYQFNQHLMDSLCLQILELDGLALVEHEPSDREAMDEQEEKKHFAAVLMSLRVLAKFFGFLVFLPYRTSEPVTGDLLESAVLLRNQTHPVLDVFKLLKQSIQKQCTVLTIPWVVEFLSLMDCIAPFLDYYGKIFALLLQLYRCMLLSENKGMCFLNKLLILAVLGWLFQVPAVSENLFFADEEKSEKLITEPGTKVQALDSVPLVDQQLLYTCCPYLGELKKLLSSFVLGSGGKNGGYIRKITPTAAEAFAPKTSITRQKLQAELEQAFFHNQSPSLRRTVEFVAERIGSNCVKHIKATLVAELVKRAEVMLQDNVKEEEANYGKLLDEVCSQLYEEGAQALIQGKEFCRKKGPEAVEILLPEETSAAVLSCASNIAVGLATEKACAWLSTNITALIKREVKATFSRMLKVQALSLPSPNETVQKKKGCPPDCSHQTSFPSQIINEIKDVLCIAVGPRDEDEEIQFAELESLLRRLSQTLCCRKFICPASEQQLAKCTVELASLLVSDRVPIQRMNFQVPQKQEQQPAKSHLISSLLKSLLSVWKEDFQAPVPLQLIFSRKNAFYLADNKQRKWDLFLFMLHGLVEHGLMTKREIQSGLHQLLKLPWPFDFSKELEALSSIFVSENYIAEPKTLAYELLGQPRGTVAAQS
ncbi:codanin-1 isoform X2 [Anolis carolinensis]|uniref:Codanin-1 C-terminal domain-containing protein n=1 Tax=Anolis carolinensis TaxID=28377 RepID=G1KYC3_ANOCA|nr:PREDICTED: codanin-1 isoform X2 [Anolis carolinensis]|eukprot:XP_008102326.1 PREDICTED: codanin-1 isoform X2 [Anolis carolinensis]